MALVALQTGLGSGLAGSIAQVAVLAGTLVLALMLAALGSFAYRSLRGDGIRWPDEMDETDPDEEVSRGSPDDEWDYY